MMGKIAGLDERLYVMSPNNIGQRQWQAETDITLSTVSHTNGHYLLVDT